METPQIDPQEAYRKQQFVGQSKKTLSTINIGKAERVESPEGMVGIRVVKDPVETFLKERGFQGDPKIDYSVQIKVENSDSPETIHFNVFDDVKKFIAENADKVVAKPGQVAYRTDYDPSVYAWSEGLPPEESQSLMKAWEKLGLDIVLDSGEEEPIKNVDREASKRRDQKRLEEVRAELGIPNKSETVEPEKILEKDLSTSNKENENKSPVNMGIFESPRFKALATEGPRNHFSLERVASVAYEGFKKVYPNPDSLSKRIAEIITQLNTEKEAIQKNSPGKDDFAYQAYAIKKLLASLTEAEKQAIEDVRQSDLESQDQKAVTNKIPAEDAMTAFIEFASKNNQ